MFDLFARSCMLYYLSLYLYAASTTAPHFFDPYTQPIFIVIPKINSR